MYIYIYILSTNKYAYKESLLIGRLQLYFLLAINSKSKRGLSTRTLFYRFFIVTNSRKKE